MSDAISIDISCDLAEAALVLLDIKRHGDSDIGAHQLELYRQELVGLIETALHQGGQDADDNDDSPQADAPVGDSGSASDQDPEAQDDVGEEDAH